MATKGGITFVPDKGWRQFERAIDKTRAGRAVSKHMALATRRNGLIAVKAIRAAIRSGKGFEANAALTIDIKKSQKPLVDKGGLFQSVTSQVVDKKTVFAGVLQTDELFNIARALHEGAVVPVSPKMRNMFRMLWWASIGNIDPSELTGGAALLWERKPGDWLPLKESTTAIIIPGRPFVEVAFASPELAMKAKENWQKALASAFKELAKR